MTSSTRAPVGLHDGSQSRPRSNALDDGWRSTESRIRQSFAFTRGRPSKHTSLPSRSARPSLVLAGVLARRAPQRPWSIGAHDSLSGQSSHRCRRTSDRPGMFTDAARAGAAARRDCNRSSRWKTESGVRRASRPAARRRSSPAGGHSQRPRPAGIRLKCCGTGHPAACRRTTLSMAFLFCPGVQRRSPFSLCFSKPLPATGDKQAAAAARPRCGDADIVLALC